jgi:hypothetical protein
MPAAVILEFEGITEQQYDAVNEKLGLDPKAGTGDWPDGLVNHLAGRMDDGGFFVSEIWDSPAHQAAFMDGRLGAALAEVGVPAPTRVTWAEVVAHHSP